MSKSQFKSLESWFNLLEERMASSKHQILKIPIKLYTHIPNLLKFFAGRESLLHCPCLCPDVTASTLPASRKRPCRLGNIGRRPELRILWWWGVGHQHRQPSEPTAARRTAGRGRSVVIHSAPTRRLPAWKTSPSPSPSPLPRLPRLVSPIPHAGDIPNLCFYLFFCGHGFLAFRVLCSVFSLPGLLPSSALLRSGVSVFCEPLC